MCVCNIDGGPYFSTPHSAGNRHFPTATLALEYYRRAKPLLMGSFKFASLVRFDYTEESTVLPSTFSSLKESSLEL